MRVDRQAFYGTKRIFEEVKNKVIEAKARDERIDYLTFVPDGELTLDINLGKEVSLLRQAGIPIAVLTTLHSSGRAMLRIAFVRWILFPSRLMLLARTYGDVYKR